MVDILEANKDKDTPISNYYDAYDHALLFLEVRTIKCSYILTDEEMIAIECNSNYSRPVRTVTGS